MTAPVRHPVALWLGRLARVAVVLWIVLVFVWFLRTNTHLVYRPGRWFGIFSELGGPWSFSLRNTPAGGMLQAIFALALTQLFGVLTLRALRVRLPLLEEQALAFPIGFGLSGVFLELLTMAHGLRPLFLWPLWAVMLGVAGWLAWRARGTESEALLAFPEPSPTVDDTAFPGRVERAFTVAAVVLAGLITLATFWHALLLPESYWDSLILYLGYARMTFLQGAFPFKAEAQVGIGLGANYPHLFSTYGAMASALFNHWSDLPQRLAAPVAGLASTMLVYTTCRATWRSPAVAAGAALLFRSVPYGIAYATWASDYAFAILFTAAFLRAWALFQERPDVGRLLLFALVPAVSMHLNFLMGILWVPWAGAVVVASLQGGAPLALLKRRVFWGIYFGCVAISLPWYIRNYALTGNPVYAFFPEIFTKSVRMNAEVLRSAELEWFRNGDGVGKLAESYWDLENRTERDQASPDFQRRAKLPERLLASYRFWLGYDFIRVSPKGLSFGPLLPRLAYLFQVTHAESNDTEPRGDDLVLVRWPHAYKMMILFPACFFPALVVLALTLARERGRRLAVPLVTAATALLLLAYMYLLADFYLYQIIGIVAPAAVCAGGLLAWLLTRRDDGLRRWIQLPLFAVLLLQGIAPGLAFALMNFKFTGAREIEGQMFSQTNLDAFRNPGMDPELFYRLQYGDDVPMWGYVNDHLKGQRLLTHENRHYVFDPSITLVHLDDWEVQQGWNRKSADEVYAFLKSRGLHWYLRAPMEFKHAINRRLGMELLLQAGYLREAYRSGDNMLYEVVGPPAGS